MHTEPAEVREAALRRYARHAGLGATFESAALSTARPAWQPLLDERADKADKRRFEDSSITGFGDLTSEPAKFLVEGETYSLADMLSANADDAGFCEWASTAQIGDEFASFVGCRRVA